MGPQYGQRQGGMGSQSQYGQRQYGQGGSRMQGGHGHNQQGNYGGGGSSGYQGSQSWRGEQSNLGQGMGQHGQSQHGQMSRGQHIGRGPRGYKRSDERLTEEINEKLTQHPDINAEEIEVKVQNGEVTLTGTVEDRQTKRMIEDLVEDISGVHELHNQLRVNRGNRGMSSSKGSQGMSSAQGSQSSGLSSNTGSTAGEHSTGAASADKSRSSSKSSS